MKKIAVITATRAEYGLLSPVISELRKQENDKLRIELIVTGTHLYSQYGMTVREIEASGQRIDRQVLIPVTSDSEEDISNNQAEVLMQFTRLFVRERYQAIIILGDRYEMLAVAIAAGNTHTPVFHLCGGDTTEGALDEWIRHSITKISYLHFVSNEESRRRVIQLGEEPERVLNYGSTSIDNIMTVADIPRGEALASVGLKDCRYALCTYHPVTQESGDITGKVEAFLKSTEAFSQMEFIITKSNADQGGAKINALLDQAAGRIRNIHVFASLGMRRYLSLMKYAELVLGNSSSGIIEAPAFHVPTVNIGDRQKGRLQTPSIINCGEKTEDIIHAVNEALGDRHRQLCQKVISPYGDGHAALRIACKAIEIVMSEDIDLKKRFYDLKGIL